MTCPTCLTYAAERGHVIKREIARQGDTGSVAADRWARFMVGVHERHVAISRRVVRLLAQSMGLPHE